MVKDSNNQKTNEKEIERDGSKADIDQRTSVFADANKKRMIGLAIIAGVAFCGYMYFFFGKSDEEKKMELESQKMKSKIVQTYDKTVSPTNSKSLSSKNDPNIKSTNNVSSKKDGEASNIAIQPTDKNIANKGSVALNSNASSNAIVGSSFGNENENDNDIPIVPRMDILDIDLAVPEATKDVSLPKLPKPKKVEKKKEENITPPVKTDPVVNVVAPPGVKAGPSASTNVPTSSADMKRQARGNSMILFSSGQQKKGVQDESSSDPYDKLKNKGVLSSDGDPGEDDPVERSPDQATATFLGDLRYIIAEGKIIDAVLETGINTDLEGILRAVVSRDVYAEVGATVLMPAGTRLIGEYSTSISYTQSRVDVIWTRAIMPNGIDFDLDNAKGTDSLGRAGIRGKVDNKMASIFANAFMLSSLKIASGIVLEKIVGDQNVITNENASGDVTTTSSVSAQLATEAITDLTKVAQDYIQRYTPSGASILVPQGTRIKVFVYRDLVFPRMVYSKQLKNILD